MNMTKNTIRWMCLTSAGASLLLCSGCISPGDPRAGTVYEPMRCPSQIDACATVNVAVTNTPEAVVYAKAWGYNQVDVDARCAAWAEALRNDLATSGLFARVGADNEQADYNVKLEWRWESAASGLPGFEAVLTAMRTKTKESATATVKFEPQQPPPGTYIGMPPMQTEAKIPDVMAALKTTLAQHVLAQEQIAAFPKASLPELLGSSDANSACAAARNRAIIAAKIQQLPALLRENKTEELTALLVKIEQAMLDLNHGSEVAKDRAQQMVAEGKGQGQGTLSEASAPRSEELRDLSISYQERIELLKPIAVALKEEIANRNR
jgi:hypothetical protein